MPPKAGARRNAPPRENNAGALAAEREFARDESQLVKRYDIEICWGVLKERADARELLAKATAFASARGLSAQLFDAAAVVGEDHLRSAAFHALRARERGKGRASSLEMELLLYASGRRQIRDALRTLGVGERTRAVAAALVGPGAKGRGKELIRAIGAVPGGARLAGGRRALARLGLDTRDKDAALEMVALLDVERM